MKRTLLLCLISGLFMSGIFAQQNVQKFKTSNDYSYSYPDTQRLKPLYAEVLKKQDPPKLHVNPDQIPSRKPRYLINSRPEVTDHMPILKPRGYSHGIAIKPDANIDFKLIIKRP